MILTTSHIKEVIKGFFEQKPVKKVWLFGSYARGEANEESDVDISVDLDHTIPIGWDYFIWFDELAEQLNKKVDIVSCGWENKYVKSYIDKDKQVIYERDNF